MDWVTKQSIVAILKAAWRRVDGPVYIVINVGNKKSARIAETFELSKHFGNDIRLIPDPTGILSSVLEVRSTPCAVMLDVRTRISSVGTLSLDPYYSDTKGIFY